MNHLSKQEWSMLDDLLGKHGFGGYYDLVECLKIILRKVGHKRLKPDWEAEVKDLPSVVNLLMVVTKE